MTERHLRALISCGTAVLLCAAVVGAMFGLFLVNSGVLPILALTGGGFVWGSAARALRTSRLALPAIALAVEPVVAFEFKRLYVLDYVGGPPPRSLGVFVHSLFLSDLVIAAILTAFGLLGWHWKRTRVSATVAP